MWIFRKKHVLTESQVEIKAEKNILPFTLKLCQVSKSIFNLSRDILDSSKCLGSLSNRISSIVKVNKGNMDIVENQMTSIKTEVNEINKSSIENKKISQENIENIDTGKQKLTDSINKIEDLSSYYGNMFEILNRLDKYSQNISNIVNYMNDISSKTQLLSLNASIEAARAGEAGRGFKVITEEIKSLASQSHEFSREIEDVLKNVSSCINEIQSASDINFEKIAGAKTSVLDMWSVLDNVSTSIVNLDKNIDITMDGNNKISNSVNVGMDKVNILKDSFNETSNHIFEIVESIKKQHNIISEFEVVSEDITDVSEKQLDLSLSSDLNKKLIDIGSEVSNYAGSKNSSSLNSLANRLNIHSINYSNKEGVFVYGSNDSALGLNIFELDKRFKTFVRGIDFAKPYPISRNYETGELFKFMAVKRSDGEGVISVGFDLNRLIKINNSLK